MSKKANKIRQIIFDKIRENKNANKGLDLDGYFSENTRKIEIERDLLNVINEEISKIYEEYKILEKNIK